MLRGGCPEYEDMFFCSVLFLGISCLLGARSGLSDNAHYLPIEVCDVEVLRDQGGEHWLHRVADHAEIDRPAVAVQETEALVDLLLDPARGVAAHPPFYYCEFVLSLVLCRVTVHRAIGNYMPSSRLEGVVFMFVLLVVMPIDNFFAQFK